MVARHDPLRYDPVGLVEAHRQAVAERGQRGQQRPPRGREAFLFLTRTATHPLRANVACDGLGWTSVAARTGPGSDLQMLTVSAEGHGSFLEQALAAGVDDCPFTPFTCDAPAGKVELSGVRELLTAARLRPVIVWRPCG